MVGLVGQWLESAGGAAGLRRHRHACSRAAFLEGSMVGPLFAQTAWTNVTFIGSEVARSGQKSGTRACRRVRRGGRTLFAG